MPAGRSSSKPTAWPSGRWARCSRFRLLPATVEVFVTEGRVRVDDAARGGSLLAPPAPPTLPPPSTHHAERLLQPGEKVVIPVHAGAFPVPAAIATVSAREIEDALAWRQRWLNYTDAPLSEIVADFNRHNQHRLVIADSRAGRPAFRRHVSSG